MTDPVLASLLDSIDKREAVAVITVTDAGGRFSQMIGNRCAVWLDKSRSPIGDLGIGDWIQRALEDARHALYERQHRTITYPGSENQPADWVTLFVEVQVQPPHLIIVGAGHIAVPLAQIAKINDFQVTVLDDRPQYAHPARFPTADNVIAGPFRQEINKLRPEDKSGAKRPFDGHTYMVLVTRGHQYDIESLLEVLDDPMAYIGMIGSQRRIRAVFDLLEEEQDIPAEKFDRIYAPIGIDIGARTPAEIAVCIMAEIINVLRDGPAMPLSQQIRLERQRRRRRAADQQTA